MPNEIRQDKVTGEWVIYAPGRGDRPNETSSGGRETDAAADDSGEERWRADCPFCPGHEDRILPVLLETDGLPGRPWGTRVVLNKYPALREELPAGPASPDFYRAMPGHGRHEVVIESPYHDEDPFRMPPEALEGVLETYQQRYHALRHREEGWIPILFRNYGAGGGASLRHPHAQILATPVAPRRLRRREAAAQTRFDETGRCVYCEVLAHEARSGERVVFENEAFLAFVPFAARLPYELWVMPRRHRPDFGEASGSELAGLAAALQAVLRRLHLRLGDPPYNLTIQVPLQYRSPAPHLHWYIRILPKLIGQGGFEIATGIPILTSMPEAYAEALRE